MSCKFIKAVLLAFVVVGLCACAQVNTTARSVSRPVAPVVVPPTAEPSTSAPVAVQQEPPGTSSAEAAKIPRPAVTATPLPAQRLLSTRIALLLPLKSENLGQIASVVRSGFMAGYEREKEPGMTITLLETGDAVQDVLNGYNQAVLNNDIVVGPLTRSGVAAVIQSGTVSKPTITLAQPETTAGTELSVPQKILAIGLSAEDEARQVANWARDDRPVAKALIVSTSTAWQRRAARAFGAQWQRQGARVMTAELDTVAGVLNPDGLLQLRKRIESEGIEFLFVALDAIQTRQLREAVGTDMPMYGTSQLNPYALADWPVVERLLIMDGVRLADIPWQLQPDHPAVMVYPRLVVAPDQRRSADLERLYALGIDAYRIAREIALNRSRFELDGVTGKLAADLNRNTMRFERTVVPAVYRDGIVVPLVTP